eukprot:scaffold549_cov385-Prasinococcus_capsulatus_cf.AAC.11
MILFHSINVYGAPLRWGPHAVVRAAPATEATGVVRANSIQTCAGHPLAVGGTSPDCRHLLRLWRGASGDEGRAVLR